MNDLTEKFVHMIEAFECDFNQAKNGKVTLSYIQNLIDDDDENLLRDIELLSELSFLLRHGKAVIVEK